MAATGNVAPFRPCPRPSIVRGGADAGDRALTGQGGLPLRGFSRWFRRRDARDSQADGRRVRVARPDMRNRRRASMGAGPSAKPHSRPAG